MDGGIGDGYRPGAPEPNRPLPVLGRSPSPSRSQPIERVLQANSAQRSGPVPRLFVWSESAAWCSRMFKRGATRSIPVVLLAAQQLARARHPQVGRTYPSLTGGVWTFRVWQQGTDWGCRVSLC